MQRFGIDVSRWQGDFDFANAKEKDGVEFAILKIGGADDGLYEDSKFESNYSKCAECGLDKGVYYFGHALTLDDAQKETEHLLSLLKDRKLEYPVFYDVEGDMLDNDKQTITDIIKYVLSTVEAAGYFVGLYGSLDNIEYYADDTQLTHWAHWMAKYSSEKPELQSGLELGMWQFGGSTNKIRSNKVNGVVCDQNYCYVDYPSLITAAGLNGYKKEIDNTSSNNTVLAAGQAITLNNTALYNTATTSSVSSRRSGVYYLWSTQVINGRIRITNTKERVGVNGQVTGWLNVSDIKAASTTSTATTSNTLKVGSKVKVKSGAKFYDGVQPAKFVYSTIYDVLRIMDDKVVIGVGESITGVMNNNDLIIQ